jgi:hypothetical protein
MINGWSPKGSGSLAPDEKGKLKYWNAKTTL